MKPWEKTWRVDRPLGAGGQGTTFVVTSQRDGTTAVLKTLKRDGDAKARRRMYQEVTNLRILHSARADVPAVLDGNVDEYESLDVPLFFVMEFVDGVPLSEKIRTEGPLALEEAVRLTSRLSESTRIAFGEEVLHRDLKPDNIILRTSSGPPVIIDYGLSFNMGASEADNTSPTETIDSAFLSLPEGRLHGASRRDARSDLTALCGILLFCLSGQVPSVLLDAEGKPPHRRTGVRDLWAIPEWPRLERFFDRGFSTVLESRFQTIDELSERLASLLVPAALSTPEDPRLVAQEASRRLLQQTRRARLPTFRMNAKALADVARKHIESYRRPPLDAFAVSGGTVSLKEGSAPSGTEPLGGESFSLQISTQLSRYRYQAIYILRAQGEQIVVYRMIRTFEEKGARQQGESTVWTPIAWFPGLEPSDPKAILHDIDAHIVNGVRELERNLLAETS